MLTTKEVRLGKSYIGKIIALTLGIFAISAFFTQTAHARIIGPYYDGTYPAAQVADPEPQEFITTANLNLRSGPCTSYERLTLLQSGTVITVTEFVADGFSTVIANGRHGFVYSEFIRPHTNTPTTAPHAAPAAPRETVAHGNVELLHWREVREILPQNTHLQITDVRTGYTYFVRNWSNGNHADVDPLTYQDTQTLRATFGGRWSWDPRPVLVTANGRTFAAAINGMPHGGSMTAGNGVNGHFCLHFYGATTHNGNRRYEGQMQAAVMEAFNSAR